MPTQHSNTTQFLHKYGYFGAWSLNEGEKYKASVVAKDNTTCIVMEKPHFDKYVAVPNKI